MVRNGNVQLQLQVRGVENTNEIGEQVAVWETVENLTGWLDLSAGDSKYTAYNAKMQESTHVFICAYKELGNAAAENSRAVIDGSLYDVMLIDDPLNMHRQLELYLKYTGGQNGG